MGVLTLAVILLVHQVAVHTVRLGPDGPLLKPLDDGPEVGSSVAAAVTEALPSLAGANVGYLLLLSAHCIPCRELAATLPTDVASRGYDVFALVPGRTERADEVVGMLPDGVHSVRDPVATRVARALKIESVPFVVEIANGIVTGRIHPPNIDAEALDSLIAERSQTVARKPLRNASREVVRHAG